jgi:hypothetical protein
MWGGLPTGCQPAADCQSASAAYVIQNIRGIQRAVRRPIGNRAYLGNQVGNPPHMRAWFLVVLKCVFPWISSKA